MKMYKSVYFHDIIFIEGLFNFVGLYQGSNPLKINQFIHQFKQQIIKV